MTLDLIRGVAVLGILAINVTGFAGPIAASYSPNLPAPLGPAHPNFADAVEFSLALLLFEGKMRALFSLLFGAGILLFIARADAATPDHHHREGERLQMRRLFWLGAAGYLHYMLFWWGDILFTYALAGFLALPLRHLRARTLGFLGLVLFLGSAGAMGWQAMPGVLAEQRVVQGHASPIEARDYVARQGKAAADTTRELAQYHQGFAAQISAKLRDDPLAPLSSTLASLGETLPLMLIGMALHGSGFFTRTGFWTRRRLLGLATGGILAGALMTGALIFWLGPEGFPPDTMIWALAYALALPHLLMALGYAAALVLAGPRLAATALGQRLIAAGRMAFSNYLGITLVMTAIFYGWGLDLVGKVPPRWQWLFMLGGWALMLGWSKPWLARFRQGPLEWAWRSLTFGQRLPLRRIP